MIGCGGGDTAGLNNQFSITPNPTSISTPVETPTNTSVPETIKNGDEFYQAMAYVYKDSLDIKSKIDILRSNKQLTSSDMSSLTKDIALKSLEAGNLMIEIESYLHVRQEKIVANQNPIGLAKNATSFIKAGNTMHEGSNQELEELKRGEFSEDFKRWFSETYPGYSSPEEYIAINGEDMFSGPGESVLTLYEWSGLWYNQSVWNQSNSKLGQGYRQYTDFSLGQYLSAPISFVEGAMTDIMGAIGGTFEWLWNVNNGIDEVKDTIETVNNTVYIIGIENNPDRDQPMVVIGRTEAGEELKIQMPKGSFDLVVSGLPDSNINEPIVINNVSINTDTTTSQVIKYIEDVTYVSQSLPDGSVISPTHNFTQTYTFKNTGTTTLRSNYKLYFDGGSQMNAPYSINLSSSVYPGQEFQLSIPMTVPSTPGIYTNYWQIKDSLGNKLGPQVSTQINCTADYMGQIVEQSPNPELNLYTTKEIYVKIKNTGTKPWNPDEVHLGTYNPQDRGSHFSHPNNSNGFNEHWLSDNRVRMDGNDIIEHDQIATFKITITDGWNPSTNGPRLGKGTHKEEFKLVKDTGTPTGWFLDDTLSWDITVTDPLDYYCCWISQTDHPTLAKGATKELTVKFKNLGKTAWNPSVVHLGTDIPQDRNCGFYTPADPRWLGTTNRIKMVETSPVQPGQDANFTFTITGDPPQGEGTYREYFRLVADSDYLGVIHQWFNDVGLFWNITVGDAGGAVIVVDKKGGK